MQYWPSTVSDTDGLTLASFNMAITGGEWCGMFQLDALMAAADATAKDAKPQIAAAWVDDSYSANPSQCSIDVHRSW